MARESQGLQVLLIGFVMLSVGLGASLYIYVKKVDEATKAATAAAVDKQQIKEEKTAMEKERDDLKTLIGLPQRSIAEIKKQFAEDTGTYGNEPKLASDTDKTGANKPLLDAGALGYSRLLAAMHKVIQDRTDELTRSRAQWDDQQRQFKNREAASAATIEGLLAGYQKLEDQIKKIEGVYNSGQKATQADYDQLVTLLKQIKNEAARETLLADEARKKAEKELRAKEDEVRAWARRFTNENRQGMDVPSGEILRVSLPTKTVWINRGRADALPPQMQFTVYSADAKAVKKGTVEVTQIEDDHLAQARILNDKLADPILPGDKVFTPLWLPGQQRHFALTGIMNLDGHNRLSVVLGWIKAKGAAVDCWLNEEGHKQGQITVDTCAIVVGDAPDRGSPEFVKNHGDLLRDAERYNIPAIRLSDFKHLLGY